MIKQLFNNLLYFKYYSGVILTIQTLKLRAFFHCGVRATAKRVDGNIFDEVAQGKNFSFPLVNPVNKNKIRAIC